MPSPFVAELTRAFEGQTIKRNVSALNLHIIVILGVRNKGAVDPNLPWVFLQKPAPTQPQRPVLTLQREIFRLGF